MAKLYSEHELKQFPLEKLQLIAKEENIVAAGLVRDDSAKLINLILRYCKKPGQRLIRDFTRDDVDAYNQYIDLFQFTEDCVEVRIPTQLNVYQNIQMGIESGLEISGVYGGIDMKQSNALLLKRDNPRKVKYEIVSFLTIQKHPDGLCLCFEKTALTHLTNNKDEGKKYYLGFFKPEGNDDNDMLYKTFYNRDHLAELKDNEQRITCYVKKINHLELLPLRKPESALVIYLGTKCTYAMGCKDTAPIEIPSTIFVKHIDAKSTPDYAFGHEAIEAAHDVIFGQMANASYFANIKKWTENYHTNLTITDWQNESKTVKTLDVLKSFLTFVIETTRTRHQTDYDAVCILCPAIYQHYYKKMYTTMFGGADDYLIQVFPQEYATLYERFPDPPRRPEQEFTVLSLEQDNLNLIQSSTISATQPKKTGTGNNYTTYEFNQKKLEHFHPFGMEQLGVALFKYLKILLARYYTEPSCFNKPLMWTYETADDAFATFGDLLDENYHQSNKVIPTQFNNDQLDEVKYKQYRQNFYRIKALAETVINQFFPDHETVNEAKRLREKEAFERTILNLLENEQFEEIKKNLDSYTKNESNRAKDNINMETLCKDSFSHHHPWKLFVYRKEVLREDITLPKVEIYKSEITYIFKYILFTQLNALNLNVPEKESLVVLQEKSQYDFLNTLLVKVTKKLCPDRIQLFPVTGALSATIDLYKKLRTRDKINVGLYPGKEKQKPFPSRICTYLCKLDYELIYDDGKNTPPNLLETLKDKGEARFTLSDTIQEYTLFLKNKKKDINKTILIKRDKAQEHSYGGDKGREIINDQMFGYEIKNNDIIDIAGLNKGSASIYLCESINGFIKMILIMHDPDPSKEGYYLFSDVQDITSHFEFFTTEEFSL